VKLHPSGGITALRAVVNEDLVGVGANSNLSTILVECVAGDAGKEALLSIRLDRHFVFSPKPYTLCCRELS